MAYRISATTDEDKEILDALRHMAWLQRTPVSQVMREAFLTKVYGSKRFWPEEYRHIARFDPPNRGDEMTP